MINPRGFFLSFLIGILTSFSLFSQSITINPNYFTIRKNSIPLLFPLLGGLNSPRVQFGDIDGDKKTDMLILSQGELFVFRRLTSTEFQFIPKSINQTGIQNWIVLGDLNSDGFSDLLSDDGLNQVQLILNNKKSNHWFDGTPVQQFTTANQPVITESLSQPTLYDSDNDGALDLFSGLSTGTIVRYKNTGSPSQPKWTYDTDHFGNITVLLDTVLTKSLHKKSLHGASAVQLYDLNKDGFGDIFFGDFFSHGVYFFLNKANPDTAQFEHITPSFPNSSNLNTVGFNQVNFSDYDQSSNDLFVTVNFPTSDKDNFFHFRNIGTANDPIYEFITNQFISMPDIGSKSHLVRLDINNDGLRDLLLTGESGKISAFISNSENEFFWLTDSWGNLTSLNNLSPAITDINGDQLPDIVHGMFDGKLRCYVQQPNHTFSEQNHLILTDQPNNDFGSYSVPAFSDWDSDGDPDLVVGNSAGSVSFIQNNGTAQIPIWNKLPESRNVESYGSPFFYDWNHDGKPDLICGNENGDLSIFFRQPESSLTLFSLTPDFIFRTGIRGLSPAEIKETNLSWDILSGCNRGGIVLFSIAKESQIISSNNLFPYPNPASENLTIRVPDYPGDFFIYNVLGQQIYQTKIYHSEQQISVKSFSQGLYFIYYRTPSKNYQGRFIIIR